LTASDKISGDWSDFRKALGKQFFKNYGKSIKNENENQSQERLEESKLM
jgi:hypothetical protein